MKKTLLITCVLGLAPPMALAQGTVNFGTTAAAHKVVYYDGTPVGGGFKAALYWGPLGSLEGDLIQLGATTGVTGGTGFLVPGGTRTTGVATAEGTDATFQLRAWNGTANTWHEAITGIGGTTGVGKTALFPNPTGAPNASPPTAPAFLTGWTEPIVIWPEPSSLALITLGLGALGLHRLRRSRKTDR